MIFGVGFYSFTVGSLSSIIADMDAKNADIRVRGLLILAKSGLFFRFQSQGQAELWTGGPSGESLLKLLEESQPPKQPG